MLNHAFFIRSSCLWMALLFSVNSVFAAENIIRFAVGPYQPTPTDTQRAFDPFFKFLADKLGMKYELRATTEQAGVAVALANRQADVAWMGPWGYVLAHNASGVDAIATVKYDGKPTYHSIVVGKPGLPIKKWPDDAKGLSMSFANASSTSGYLMPTFWFQKMGIDPKTFFKYREGASHAAQEIAVVSGQTDLATDYDRNRTSMIETGKIPKDATQIYWTSPPLPNDALAVRKGLDPDLVRRIREIVLSIDEQQAQAIMPNHYTGWVSANHGSYKMIEDAGIETGKLKVK